MRVCEKCGGEVQKFANGFGCRVCKTFSINIENLLLGSDFSFDFNELKKELKEKIKSLDKNLIFKGEAKSEYKEACECDDIRFKLKSITHLIKS